MDKIDNPTKRRCQAMIDAGIEDPESHAGITFCAGTRDGSVQSRCPYDYCVVMEDARDKRREVNIQRAVFARQLHRHGVSIKDIALILSRATHTIRGYLKK